MKRVLVTCPHLQRTLADYSAWFSERDLVVDAPPLKQQLTEDELLEIIDRYDGVVAGDDPFTARVLERGSKLKIVAKWGIGLDGIDREAAARLGIRVTNTPGAFGDEVADVAIAYVVLLVRRLHDIDRGVREGRWPKPPGRSLSEMSLGVVGLGDIGQSIVRRGQTMGMRVLGTDPSAVVVDGIERVSIDELAASSDFVVLACSLNADNHHLINAERIASMRRGAYVVNVSRGALVDTDALIDALERQHLSGAALEVMEREPPEDDLARLARDDVILGSHNASNTREAVARVNVLALEHLERGLNEVER